MEQNTMKYKVKQYLMFAGVSTVLFCAVVILPFIYGLYLTFTSWDGVSKEKPFVGLANYIATFQDAAYWQALGRTLIYSVIAVILVNVVAFFLAYLLTSGIKGHNFFRAAFFVPNLIGGIVLGYVWKFVFNRAFVALGKSLSVGALSTSWLATTNGAMACLIIVSVWQYAGYMMLIYVAGFMSVSKSLMEAAQIDGASTWQVYRKITLPLLVPVIKTCVIFAITGSLRAFDLVYVMTGGGPNHISEVPATLMYNNLFRKGLYGYGSAQAFFIVIECLIFTFIVNRLFKKAEQNVSAV